MRSAGPARAATIALGIASAFENIERRNAARQTWMRLQSVGRTLHVRFVLRVPTVGGTSALRTARLERNIHKDVLIVRVSPGVIDALHGRLLTLHLWLQRAVVLFRRCAWICKADDDAYIVVPSYAQQLGLMSRALSPHNRSIIHGLLGWSAWDPLFFMPEIASSFDGDFCKTGRAGLLFGNRCRGSFPFVSGWLISLSSHLARALAASAAAAHDVHTMTGHLNRSWIVLEDVWLGYLLCTKRGASVRTPSVKAPQTSCGLVRSMATYLTALAPRESSHRQISHTRRRTSTITLRLHSRTRMRCVRTNRRGRPYNARDSRVRGKACRWRRGFAAWRMASRHTRERSLSRLSTPRSCTA